MWTVLLYMSNVHVNGKINELHFYNLFHFEGSQYQDISYLGLNSTYRADFILILDCYS